MRTILLSLVGALALIGCQVEPEATGGRPPSHAGAEGPPPVPALEGPREVRILGGIHVGQPLTETFPAGERVAAGYVVVLRGDAAFDVHLRAEGVHESYVYGPVGPEGWGAAPVVGRDGGDGELDSRVPADGTYLIAALGIAGESFSLDLECRSEECRLECAPDSTCPEGGVCAIAQCAGEPCPSFCQAIVVPEPEAAAEGPECGEDAPCEAGHFCLYPEGTCPSAEARGRCTETPRMCTRDYRPVCGCDDRTHGNPCTAHAAGVSIRRNGPCEQSERIPTPTPPAQPNPPAQPTPPGQAACVRGGCSGQLCIEEGNDIASTCEYRPEYACYESARCERQSNGGCGWSQTAELTACLRQRRSGAPE